MRMLDLFAGIGGFSLAAHWAGWETAAFVEKEETPQRVLAKNFPGIPIYSDIYDFHYEKEKEKIGPVDVVCGGFPCQPFSHAGKRKGKEDERHLWPEMLRVIRETKPIVVVGENVVGITSMDNGDIFESICSDLEGEGYKVQPFNIPACAKGAPHKRDRVWIIGYSQKCGRDRTREAEEGYKGEIGRSNIIPHHPNSNDERRGPGEIPEKKGKGSDYSVRGPNSTNDSNSNCKGLEGYGKACQGTEGWEKQGRYCTQDSWKTNWIEAATSLCRVDDGVSGGVDRTNRLKALGNSIVPQIAYEIFKAIDNLHKV